MGGPLGEVFSFNCQSCTAEIRRPVNSIKNPVHVHCINPDCSESYMLELDNDGDCVSTRQTVAFKCKECGEDLNVPITEFYNMTIRHQLRAKCFSCSGITEVIMQPKSKYEAENTRTRKYPDRHSNSETEA